MQATSPDAPHAAPGRQTPYGHTGPAPAYGDFGGRCQDKTIERPDRNYALALHGVGLLGALDVSGIVVTLLTYILWKIRAADSAFLDDHGREATNFQISLLIYTVGLIVVSIPLGVITLGLWVPVAALLGIGIYALRLVGVIRAMVFTGQNCYYRYPMCIRVAR